MPTLKQLWPYSCNHPADFGKALALVSSTQALQAAETAGGKPYREGRTDVIVIVSTEWLGDDEMVWVVRYAESGSPRDLYRFAVHAQTGEVLDPR
jgi:hypothetical protein